MNELELLVTILSTFISLLVLIFVLVKLQKIEKNTRTPEGASFNKAAFYQHLMIGDKVKLQSFLQEETTRLLGESHIADKNSGYVDSSWYVEQVYKEVTSLCEAHALELPEVLIKYKDVKSLKELLK